MKRFEPTTVGMTVALLAVALLSVNGCSSKSAAPGISAAAAQAQSAIECPYPDAPNVAAPTWICDEPIPGWQVTAVGSAVKSNAGHSMDKEMATAKARDELARSMRTHVRNMIKRFARKTGIGEGGTIDAVDEVVSRQVTKETLFGSRIIKSRTSLNGTVYVAVGLDTQRVVENTKEAIKKAKSSMKSAEAQYQTLQANKAMEELDERVEELNGEIPPTTKGEE